MYVIDVSRDHDIFTLYGGLCYIWTHIIWRVMLYLDSYHMEGYAISGLISYGGLCYIWTHIIWRDELFTELLHN